MKIGKHTIVFENKPVIIATGSAVGPKEKEGPLGDLFDTSVEDVYFGEKTFEKAESKFMGEAIDIAIKKANLNIHKIDYMFAGDLLNQCISSGYTARNLAIPFFGLYGACSTFAESNILAASFVNAGYAFNAVASASSHFCASERQFRMPLEHGNQKSPLAQCTVTGSGAALVTDRSIADNGIHITHVTPGKIIDLGVTDMSNMGAAMAPSVYSTISNHLTDTGRTIDYYDCIFTGDLGVHGSDMLHELFKNEGIDITQKHKDCGVLIYDQENQDVNSGGSGCGCIASVFSGYIFNELKAKRLNKILLIATGALMSPTSSNQGESIPGIAHAIAIENEV